MEETEILVQGSSEYDVVIQQSSSELDEVVVVGYGRVKKSNLTGAVSSVDMDDVPKIATNDVANILTGRVAGLSIRQSSAAPGGGNEMIIRGAIQGSDFVVFRYADVILSRAEALNELNGPTQEVIDLINMIRERANTSLIKLEDYTQESLSDFILNERGLELYGEGHRRDDLIRFGEFINKARERGIDAQDYHVLFPIPQSALNENPNLTQNTGY